MECVAEVCGSEYKRVELKSRGPLSIWMHHLRDANVNDLKHDIEILPSTFSGGCMTVYVHTELKIKSDAPIWIPDFIDVLVEVEDVVIISKNCLNVENVIEITPKKNNKNKVAIPVVAVVRCANVAAFGDIIEFRPMANSTVYVEGGRGHKIVNKSESTKIYRHFALN